MGEKYLKQKKTRNNAIDLLKCIAAYFVVAIHYNHVSGEVGAVYTRMFFSIINSAVPIFFIITGYYLPSMVEDGKVGRHLRKVLIMAISSSVFYFMVYFTDAYFRGNWEYWISSHFTLGTMLMWLTGQDDPIAYHLWYVYCLLWTLVFCVFLLRRVGLKVLCVSAILFLLYPLLRIKTLECYATSIPCVAIGCMLRKATTINVFYIKIIAPFIAFLTTTCLLIESYMQLSLAIHNIIRIISAAAYVAIAISWGKSTLFPFLARIGLKYSAYIYVFHVFINYMLNFIISYDSIFLQVVRPLIIFIVSLIFAIFYSYMKKYIIHLWSIIYMREKV